MNEDEYVEDDNNENEDGEVTEGSSPYTLPDGVIERLNQYANRVGKGLHEVIDDFLADINKQYGSANPSEEDEDLLIDWAEGFLTDTRNETRGGGTLTGSEAFVGMFVGVHADRKDRRASLVTRAKRDFTLDPEKAIGGGTVGHYLKKEGAWYLNNKSGSTKVDTPVDEVPEHSFTADGQRICLLAQSGRPKAMAMMGRYYYFLGAPESKFTDDGAIQIWRLDMQGEDADCVVRVGEPCRLVARANPNAKEGWKDVLMTSMGTKDNIVYTNDFVDDSMKPLLAPFKFWCDTELHPYYTSLEDLVDAFEAGSRTFTIGGEQGRSGPIVFVKGQINRMSTEARDNEYDEDKRGYSLTLTNSALTSQYGKGMQSDVMCWMGSACNDLTNPFMFRENPAVSDEMLPYGEKSTVLVCGRIAVKRVDGNDIPNLKVMGVFADWRRVRRRQTGGDTSKEQFD